MLTLVEHLDEQKDNRERDEIDCSIYHNWTFPLHFEHVPHVTMVHLLCVTSTMSPNIQVPRESSVLLMEHRDRHWLAMVHELDENMLEKSPH